MNSTCPNCGAEHAVDDVFCENCGYDFLTGTLPPGAEAPGTPDAPLSSGQVPGPSGEAAGSTEVPPDSAVVSVDLDFFARMKFSGVSAPDHLPEPVRVELPETDILVGRHSASRGVFPEIDPTELFGGDAADPAVSARHCLLQRGEGGWTVTDLGSTNGTYISQDTDPLPVDNPVELAPGTPIFVGAWTRIDLT